MMRTRRGNEVKSATVELHVKGSPFCALVQGSFHAKAKITSTWRQFLVENFKLELIPAQLMDKVYVSPGKLKSKNGISREWKADLDTTVSDFLQKYERRRQVHTIQLMSTHGDGINMERKEPPKKRQAGACQNNVDTSTTASSQLDERSIAGNSMIYGNQPAGRNLFVNDRKRKSSHNMVSQGSCLLQGQPMNHEAGPSSSIGQNLTTANQRNGTTISSSKKDVATDNNKQKCYHSVVVKTENATINHESEDENDANSSSSSNRDNAGDDESRQDLKTIAIERMKQFSNEELLQAQNEIKQKKKKNEWEQACEKLPLACGMVMELLNV